MFSTQSDNCTPFVHIFDIISLFAAELEKPKIGILSKGLIFNPFPHYKILDQTKLKAIADDKLIITKMIIYVFDRVENIACTSDFSFFHNVFKNFLSQTHQNVSLCGNELTHYLLRLSV